ncbi:WD repeat-containing protein 53 [Clonorchis sinensis]|uniref:WD repeat-containing protein 53 n=1 Tax=Clonorchis sinensis TaxID=79923 RepID=G7Y486_CLOSI|nr:WD repeat-containing protein 53 [Clonorchis sinensis]
MAVNEDEVNCIDVLKGESRLAAADDSGAVQIFDTSSGEVVRTLKKHDNICSVAKFRPMRSWQLISGGLDCRVIVSDWKGTGRSVIIFELDEIINSDLFEDPQPVPTHSNEFANRASSESQASTSEYAEVEFDEFVETDEEPDDPDEGELATSHPLPSGHADSLSVPSRGGDSASGDPHVSEFERGHSDTNISELLNWQLSEQPNMVYLIIFESYCEALDVFYSLLAVHIVVVAGSMTAALAPLKLFDGCLGLNKFRRQRTIRTTHVCVTWQYPSPRTSFGRFSQVSKKHANPSSSKNYHSSTVSIRASPTTLHSKPILWFSQVSKKHANPSSSKNYHSSTVSIRASPTTLHSKPILW